MRSAILSIPDKPGEGSAQFAAYGAFAFIIGIILAAIGGASSSILLQGFGGLAILIGFPVMIIGGIGWNRAQKKARRLQLRGVPVMNPYPQAIPQQIIIQTPPTSTHSEVTREIVKVRCKNCNSLNFETANRCLNCGASL